MNDTFQSIEWSPAMTTVPNQPPAQNASPRAHIDALRDLLGLIDACGASRACDALSPRDPQHFWAVLKRVRALHTALASSNTECPANAEQGIVLRGQSSLALTSSNVAALAGALEIAKEQY